MAITIRSITTANNTGGSPTVAVTTSESPSATQINDVVVVIHCNDFYALSNMPTPTATGSPTLTAITNGTADLGANQGHAKSYTYVVNTGGAQTVTVTETGSADEEKAMIAYVLAGVDTSNPINVAGNGGSATTQDPWVLAAISPATSDAFLIAHANRGGTGGQSSLTVPAGMTSRYNTAPTALEIAGATEQLSASGSTGTRTFDAGITSAWAGLLIAVQTASGVPLEGPRNSSALDRMGLNLAY